MNEWNCGADIGQVDMIGGFGQGGISGIQITYIYGEGRG